MHGANRAEVDTTPLREPLDLPGVLSREQILERIQAEPPLVADWLDLEAQLQPNGFDLTLAEIYRYHGAGALARGDAGRVLPELRPLDVDAEGMYTLEPGPYQVIYSESLHLPNDLMALGRPRSSLNRSGVTIHTAVWDAGYHGRSTSLLVVLNPYGFRIEPGSRLLQLVFLGLSRAAQRGYRGAYQGEHLHRSLDVVRGRPGNS